MPLEIPERGILITLFKSKSCTSCKQIYPIFEEISNEQSNQAKTVLVDIQEDMQSAIDHGVMSVPTIIFFKDKKEVKRLTGAVSKDKIEVVIKSLL